MVIAMPEQGILRDLELVRYGAKRLALDQGFVDGRSLLVGADCAFSGHVGPMPLLRGTADSLERFRPLGG